jgi:hypothetical protein
MLQVSQIGEANCAIEGLSVFVSASLGARPYLMGEGGMLRLSALAVFEVDEYPNLVGSATGRSAGLASAPHGSGL